MKTSANYPVQTTGMIHKREAWDIPRAVDAGLRYKRAVKEISVNQEKPRIFKTWHRDSILCRGPFTLIGFPIKHVSPFHVS